MLLPKTTLSVQSEVNLNQTELTRRKMTITGNGYVVI